LTKRRQEKIRFALPDVLDLMVICSEAGCGLDQAMVNVSRELKHVHPAIAEELSFVNMEIMAGKARSDALRNFGRRTGEDEVKKLTAILIQRLRGTPYSIRFSASSTPARSRRTGWKGGRQAGLSYFLLLPALAVSSYGWARDASAVPKSLPDDECDALGPDPLKKPPGLPI
jgi:tight adherence protein C